MNDRRHSTRRRTSEYYLIYERDTGEFMGRLINLTAGGLRLITDHPVQIPDLVHCRLRLPDTYNGAREIFFDIESRWCEYNRVGDWYEAGYEFVDLTELARGAIDAMIHHWPQEASQLTHRPQ